MADRTQYKKLLPYKFFAKLRVFNLAAKYAIFKFSPRTVFELRTTFKLILFSWKEVWID